jgi:transcriptional regulator with XRE-family HTH domain
MSNLKNIRTQRGYSQSKLAELSGVSLRMIQYYEQGAKDINKAEVETVYKLAQALECNMEELLEVTI